MRPSVPLWQQSLDLIRKAFLSVLPHPDTAGRLALPTAHLCKHAPEQTWSGNALILHW